MLLMTNDAIIQSIQADSPPTVVPSPTTLKHFFPITTLRNNSISALGHPKKLCLHQKRAFRPASNTPPLSDSDWVCIESVENCPQTEAQADRSKACKSKSSHFLLNQQILSVVDPPNSGFSRFLLLCPPGHTCLYSSCKARYDSREGGTCLWLEHANGR